MQLHEFISARIPQAGRFITFAPQGVFDNYENALLQKEWSGVCIRPWSSFNQPALERAKCPEAIGPIGRDPHFVQLINGYWVRAITPRNVKDRWGSDWNLVLCSLDDLNQFIVCNLPTAPNVVHLLPEDGYNLDVISWAETVGRNTAVIDNYRVVFP